MACTKKDLHFEEVKKTEHRPAFVYLFLLKVEPLSEILYMMQKHTMRDLEKSGIS